MRLLPFPGVFKPPSDARMLAEWVRREPLRANSKVLDLCTGSGYLAIVAARSGASTVAAVDVSRRAVVATAANAKLNGVRVRALRGDLFSPVRGQRFDLIVSNPPYIPSVEQALPRKGPARAWEAGPSGRVFIDRICAQVRDHLTSRGTLLLVHSSLCGEGLTVRALREVGLEVEVVERRRGPLGPIVSARATALRERGLLSPENTEELMVFRARRAMISVQPHQLEFSERAV
jgi:release factor glutamine methyltransferase